jgi:hypothetical protein
VKTFALVVLANYLLRALLAAGLTLPFARVVSATGIGQFPAGDRLLFEPGGLHLLELLRLAGPELMALGEGSLRLLVVAGFIAVVARALTYSVLSSTERDTGSVVARSLTLLPGYLLIAGLALLAQVLTIGLALMFATKLQELLAASSEPRGDLAFVATAVLGVVLALSIGAVAELARASLANEATGTVAAIGRGLELARRFPARLFSRWAGYGASGLTLALGASWLVERLDVSRPGAWRVASVFLLHQLVVLALVGLQTAWQLTALRAAQEPIASR